MPDPEPRRRTSGLVVESREHVRLLTLDRPERRNALSTALQEDLVEEFLDAGESPDVRAVVLTGTGPAFSAGLDLKEIRELDARGERFRSPMHRTTRSFLEVVTECPKPTIAALNGATVAGGFELALACDIRLAAPGIPMGLPEAKIGMGANFGSVLLPKLVPRGLALELLFTGDPMTSDEAVRHGLVNRVVPAPELLDAALDLARRIAANAPVSVRRMKETVVKTADMPLWQALRLEVGPDPYTSEDRAEGIAARLEQRAPRWKGR
ncbi:enoyl-CoA hydratase/isomerase family protein [Geodermatophilus sp. YIM 151500]|uniref:enoyl-CoA hydratase/isomerase family protein n=1 Tax=Geodermatophilus sp. YIM 151500 TaxID=2984531 RepID=UPI0021E3883F|nr:enoyl-CoA hydratase/isomerase family protein [Geodermatophilus sp. YIM 151500]MCV2488209.1 enoyl-CoA hydratase/isomerase family protein [Geodermatophilus sp. YIM 151500]